MGAEQPVVERERESEELEARERDETEEKKDAEKKGEVGFEQQQQQQSQRDDVRMSMLQRLNPTNPLRIAINPKTRSAAPPPPMRFQQTHNVRDSEFLLLLLLHLLLTCLVRRRVGHGELGFGLIGNLHYFRFLAFSCFRQCPPHQN
ncbi:hypothetical protein ACLB2K_043544 [Fragaria x ananassa]